ncbi:MAG: hypothetical protein HFACDABA_00317 [Anaerolineales bacterium]|nr:hypothetical protein [Anaerolineales bacterium]
MPNKTLRVVEWMLLLLLWFMCIIRSAPHAASNYERVRAYTRVSEFNYNAWVADASLLKLSQSALGMPTYIKREQRAQAVMEHLRLVQAIIEAERRLEIIYADPAIQDKTAESAHLRAELDRLYARQEHLQPIAESIIQAQVTEILAGAGLTLGGQPIPPVLYHVSPLPLNLVVSRRDRIEQTIGISLEPFLSVEEQVKIEEAVAAKLDVSTLVVPVGGIGVYPTMVMRTDYFSWQVSTVIHEWTHNYLNLRPLGMNYSGPPEVRIMNETTASIVENELGPLVMQRFYPHIASSLDGWAGAASPIIFFGTPARDDPPPFDFRAEMHATRVRADELLADGKIEAAETYMEQRRQLFWQNGYAIRKLNQAYFAFYGAYADTPGGPAGEDPVGPAVRALRTQSDSLADFINTISQMDSFNDLLAAIGQTLPESSSN